MNGTQGGRGVDERTRLVSALQAFAIFHRVLSIAGTSSLANRAVFAERLHGFCPKSDDLFQNLSTTHFSLFDGDHVGNPLSARPFDHTLPEP